MIGQGGLDPRGRPGESFLVGRLEHDRHLRPIIEEARVAPDHDLGMAPRRLLEDPDDLALARAIATPPGLDRPAGEAIRDGLEHRLHLARQAGQDDDVLDHEAGAPPSGFMSGSAPWGRHAQRAA